MKVKVQRRKEEVSRMEGLLQRKDEREKVRRNSVGLKRAEELVRHLEEKRRSSLEERNLEVLRQYDELQRWARGEELVEADQPRRWEGPQQQGREELQLRWKQLMRNYCSCARKSGSITGTLNYDTTKTNSDASTMTCRYSTRDCAFYQWRSSDPMNHHQYATSSSDA